MSPRNKAPTGYRPRIADQELARRLASAGAVVIEGPRVCGKTTTARQAAASEVLMDADPRVSETMAVNPAMLLAGASPRLIDEWQAEPAIWNHVRRAVDDRPGLGHFILTGSAVPADDVTRHTGAGRMSRLRLRPMSLFELGHSTGHVSLKRLMAGGRARSTSSELSLEALAELLCVGGWPGHLRRRSSEAAMLANEDYLAEICRVDISRAGGVNRDPEKVTRFLQSLARNTATAATAATMARDTQGSDAAFTEETARAYLAALEQLMVVEQQPAWAPHLRSRSRLRTSRKRHFVDPSLATAGLGAGPEHLLGDVPSFGLLFESMVVRDLRVYAQAMRARVYHYRDNTGLEVDAIVDAGPGRWGAFEIKLGVGRIEDAARTLLTFAERVDTARCGDPAVLAVVTSTGYGYQRPDGVAVIPVGVLGP
ncbi:MAG: DUF4143 domain-containing protein [Gemmatimonadota bacterium]|nr:DUF4143 domain-containing protein [Gemmatimonadota bacterium]MDE2864338.1 DUF4143 domain-containing protein [Gemmatimonadota bacterium]